MLGSILSALGVGTPEDEELLEVERKMNRVRRNRKERRQVKAKLRRLRDAGDDGDAMDAYTDGAGVEKVVEAPWMYD